MEDRPSAELSSTATETSLARHTAAYTGMERFSRELTNVNGVWKETVIYDFQQSNGAYPGAGLLLDNSGNLYGATYDAGNAGGGTAFELSPSGDTWIFTLLHSFSGRLGGFCGPFAPLTMDGAGNLYGTTNCDGANRFGNILS